MSQFEERIYIEDGFAFCVMRDSLRVPDLLDGIFMVFGAPFGVFGLLGSSSGCSCILGSGALFWSRNLSKWSPNTVTMRPLSNFTRQRLLVLLDIMIFPQTPFFRGVPSSARNDLVTTTRSPSCGFRTRPAETRPSAVDERAQLCRVFTSPNMFPCSVGDEPLRRASTSALVLFAGWRISLDVVSTFTTTTSRS